MDRMRIGSDLLTGHAQMPDTYTSLPVRRSHAHKRQTQSDTPTCAFNCPHTYTLSTRLHVLLPAHTSTDTNPAHTHTDAHLHVLSHAAHTLIHTHTCAHLHTHAVKHTAYTCAHLHTRTVIHTYTCSSANKCRHAYLCVEQPTQTYTHTSTRTRVSARAPHTHSSPSHWLIYYV